MEPDAFYRNYPQSGGQLIVDECAKTKTRMVTGWNMENL